MARRDLPDVAGVAETRLLEDRRPGVGEVVPEVVPAAVPAPWTCRLRAVVWWRVPGSRMRRALDGDLPPAVRHAGTPVLVVAAQVHYLDTPVGPYTEVLAGAVLPKVPAPVVHVPFIAVDSRTSLVSGRVNWALPKVLADVGALPSSGPSAAVGAGWAVRVGVDAAGPALPALGRANLLQVGPAGPVSTTLRARAWARPARVDVEVSGNPSFAGWFPAGRCWGAVLRSGVLRIGPARTGDPGE